MTDPVTINCPTACAVTLQVEVTTPILNLTETEGAQIAGAILAVWAAAWAIKMLLRTLKISDGKTNSESD